MSWNKKIANESTERKQQQQKTLNKATSEKTINGHQSRHLAELEGHFYFQS